MSSWLMWSSSYCVYIEMEEDTTFVSAANDLRNCTGLSTCSTTSREHTTSNFPAVSGFESNISSAEVLIYVNESESKLGSREACKEAILMFDDDASIPTVRPPRRAKD